MAPSPKAPNAGARPSRQSMEQAAQWFALLRSGQASALDHERWRQWRLASPEHASAWQYVEAVNSSLAPIQSSPSRETTAQSVLAAHRRMQQRRKLLTGLLVMTGSGALGWAAWRHTALPATMMAWGADFRTSTGEVRPLTLPDEGLLWLDTGSAVNVDYSGHLRRIELVQGRILIDTAPDAADRPFVVDTRQGRLLALGTRFTVTQLPGLTRLSVYEGTVRALPAWASGSQGVLVRANEQISFTDTGPQASGPADSAGQAWTQRMLQADDMTLRQLAGELNRYWRGHISVSDEIAELRLFGSFPVDDVPATLRVLAASQPVSLSRPLPWWIRLGPPS